MYDRAPRDVTFKVGCTPAAVGPGAYDTDRKLMFRGDGYAPFLSMSSRETHSNVVDQVVAVPGPGHYDVLSPDGPKGKGPLANKCKRFSDTVSETPGPGAYHTHKFMELGCKPKSAPGVAREDEGMLISNRIKFYRKPEAPSIPSQGQAYGYEECDDGTLKRQDPPKKDTSLGPAFYSPAVSESKSTKTYKGIHFGRSSSRRWSFGAKTGPGPGEYNPYADHSTKAENVNVMDGVVPRSQPPRLPRYHELIQIQEKKRAIPGPGTYELKSSFVKPEPNLNTEGIEVDHPPFLIQSKRFAPVKSIVPAPGTYNDPRTALEVLKRVTGLKRSPFNQTAVRFNRDPVVSNTPGPGAYSIPGLGAESVRKAYMEATRKGVFGTTAPRSQPAASASEPDLPGPGHYQVVEKFTQPRFAQLDSSFASVTRRLKVPDNGVPPPGTYDTVTAFEKLLAKSNTAKPRSTAAACKHGSFMSAAPRFDTGKGSDGPGPSSYNVVMESLSKRGGVIAGLGHRFHDEKEDIPGPGAYELSPLLQDTVLKGTFNHTLGNPILPSSAPSQAQTNSSHAFLLGV
ncbi:hypothetical protein BsWGS_06117 [Bradybaena similaris]